jgi:N-acetylglucosamine-6-phosphate deacetylase
VKALLASRIFDGTDWHDDLCVLLQDDRVIGLERPDALPASVPLETLPAEHMLAPGFVDLQVNGGGGVMFNDTQDAATLRIIADAHARLGTTSILPTLISSDRPTRMRALEAAHRAIEDGVPGIAGLHLEGPFFAMARRGIHPATAITKPDRQDIEMLTKAFPGPLLITLAPEIVSLADIAALVAAGRFVFAGHSDANFAQANAGFDAGITGSTHLFNAMSPFMPREPGLAGAAMLHGMAGIIIDLLHVHPASVALAFRVMGPERLFLVSDAMATAGSDCSQFDLAGVTIRLADDRLTDANGTLAGAHLSMAVAVKRAVDGAGISLTDALRMATRTPADAVGLFDAGRIAPGSRADFVALDETHAVRTVWRGGVRLAAR